MRHITYWLLAACSLTVLTTQAAQANWQKFSRLDSFSHSENFPVYAVFNQLDSDFSRGDLAFTHNQFEAGLRQGTWAWSLIGRYDYHLSYSNAAAEVAHGAENDLPIRLNHHYPIKLRANHMAGFGVKGAYTVEVDDSLSLTLGVSLLKAFSLTHGALHGQVQTQTVDTYNGEIQARYHYSEDMLLHRPVDEPDGYGYSIDASLVWQPTPELKMTLAVDDALSKIYWQDAPFTQATLTSATVNFDSKGFINTTPLLSGIEGNENFQQTMPQRVTALASYAITNRIHGSVKYRAIGNERFTQLGFKFKHFYGIQWGLHYSPRAQAMIVQFSNQWLWLNVGLDDPNYKQAHYADIALGLTLQF